MENNIYDREMNKDKTIKECQEIVAQKHRLGNSLVTGHRAVYFTEAAELYAQQFMHTENNKWISVNERLPELYARCLFVVKSDNDWYDGKVFGGTYQGDKYGYAEFATPGMSFMGTYWQLSPAPPNT